MHTRRSTLRVATDSSDPLVTLPQVLLARTERLQAGFNAQLRRREVTKEYVALVLLDPSAQPLQPPPPLPPGGQACAASPPAPPTPPTPPAALREGSMLVHWMERRPRAPMRLSATSIEGWARCESEVLHVRCMRARRRDLCSGGGGESGGGGGGGVPMGGGESDAEAPAPSALIVAEVRGCCLPMPPAPVACPCHLPPPQVTLRLHTGRTHQLRAQVSHPHPAPARLQPGPSPPSARLQPTFSPPSARLQPAARRAYGRQPTSTCKPRLPACVAAGFRRPPRARRRDVRLAAAGGAARAVPPRHRTGGAAPFTPCGMAAGEALRAALLEAPVCGKGGRSRGSRRK